MNLVRASLACLVLASGVVPAGPLEGKGAAGGISDPTRNARFQPLEIQGVHNAFRVADGLYSGSQPEGDQAFAALARLGITTVVSVDGSKPDLDAARRHGLRYIHLPFGYDGVPTNRIAELTRAAQSSSGAVFVHCHHGMHRGPTAVALICQATQNWTTNQAEAWMRQAGTAEDYAGLYRSVAAFQQPTPSQLAAVKELPEIARTSSLVDAMVSIDEHFSRLKSCRQASWKAPANQPDISPEREALLLWEQFREILRTTDSSNRPADYRVRLSDAQGATETLKQDLLTQKSTAIEAAFARVSSTCLACHQRYRNP